MNILLHPCYFPSISHFVVLAHAEEVTFEVEDNFQKQTNRNRTYIYSANGIQLLNIPIKHSRDSRQKTKDVKIELHFDWQKQHFKSLEAAYRGSPFFEFFEAEIRPVFSKKYEFLIDLNFEAFEIVLKCLRMKINYSKTTQYLSQTDPSKGEDFRNLVDGKRDNSTFTKYTQVFDDKHGFINNLSVLDLIFNEGKYAMDYLKEQTLLIQ
jgi:hypothetical protein